MTVRSVMTDDLTPGELNVLARQRKVATVNRVAERVSIAEDLLTVLGAEHEVGATVEELLENLAALVQLTSASKSKDPDSVSRSAETPLPDFKSAKAARRLDQASRTLHLESQSVAAFLNTPWRDSGPSRGRLRVKCVRPDCDRHNTPLPKWVRVGESWVDLAPVCVGRVGGGLCLGRLTDA